MEEKFEVKIEESDTPSQDAELRLYKAFEMLISEEDIINYLNKKI